MASFPKTTPKELLSMNVASQGGRDKVGIITLEDSAAINEPAIYAISNSESLSLNSANLSELLLVDRIIALVSEFFITSYWLIKVGMQTFSAIAIPLWVGILTILTAIN